MSSYISYFGCFDFFFQSIDLLSCNDEDDVIVATDSSANRLRMTTEALEERYDTTAVVAVAVATAIRKRNNVQMAVDAVYS